MVVDSIMTEEKTNFFFKDHFKSNDTAKQYDVTTGGVTAAVTRRVLDLYSQSNSLDGKVVLDNACGTGIVTKELLTRSDNVTIEAIDISEAMVNHLNDTLSSSDRAKDVTARIMDATVYPVNIN
jgi:ubiquinone/menaquinone biosynthesis C-methylase UbiE